MGRVVNANKSSTGESSGKEEGWKKYEFKQGDQKELPEAGEMA